MAYTQTSSVSSDTTAFEQLAYFALRSQPLFEMVADVKTTNQSHPGSAVQFNIYNDLAQATSALTETSDVTAVALSDSTVTVTLAEYGNAVITTAKLRGTSFLNVDADAEQHRQHRSRCSYRWHQRCLRRRCDLDGDH
jgi:hypothetical protein